MSRASFVLASVGNAAMIVNRLDYDPWELYRGVGLDLLEQGNRDTELLMLIYKLSDARQDGIVAIDGGANIGSITVPWARYLGDRGRVIAFEPQRWPYYALCGNLALNNCFNVWARQEVLGRKICQRSVPVWHPNEPHNFGGLSLLKDSRDPCEIASQVTIDSLGLKRLDFIKLDIEGMEPDALKGAAETIARCKPVVIAETVFSKEEDIRALLPGYKLTDLGSNVLCVG